MVFPELYFYEIIAKFLYIMEHWNPSLIENDLINQQELELVRAVLASLPEIYYKSLIYGIEQGEGYYTGTFRIAKRRFRERLNELQAKSGIDLY